MRLKYVIPAAVLSLPFCILWATAPARAVTDGTTRQVLEKHEFSEHLIRNSIYAKSRHDVFVKEKRKAVPGVSVQQQLIYEPDVYTWQLAMATHRKQLAENPPVVAVPAADSVTPIPMIPGGMPPVPSGVQLTPLGDGGIAAAQPLPSDAGAKMDRILSRARSSGINQNSQLRAGDIKQRILDHMNSLNAPEPSPLSSNAPTVPILSSPVPRGTPADSFDQTY